MRGHSGSVVATCQMGSICPVVAFALDKNQFGPSIHCSLGQPDRQRRELCGVHGIVARQTPDRKYLGVGPPSYLFPDGTQIVLPSNRDIGRRQLWIMDADGENQRRLTDLPGEAYNPV